MAAKGVAAPRLPAAPVEYDARFMDALTNILRQYFNALDNPANDRPASARVVPSAGRTDGISTLDPAAKPVESNH